MFGWLVWDFWVIVSLCSLSYPETWCRLAWPQTRSHLPASAIPPTHLLVITTMSSLIFWFLEQDCWQKEYFLKQDPERQISHFFSDVWNLDLNLHTYLQYIFHVKSRRGNGIKAMRGRKLPRVLTYGKWICVVWKQRDYLKKDGHQQRDERTGMDKSKQGYIYVYGNVLRKQCK